MSKNLRKGLRFEDQARNYLQASGLVLLHANYRCRFGEIDLVMRDGDTLCFIEVKFRKSRFFGGAAASIVHCSCRDGNGIKQSLPSPRVVRSIEHSAAG